MQRTWQLKAPLDVKQTLRFAVPQGYGVVRLDDRGSSYALRTEEGVATVTVTAADGSVTAIAVGPGSEAALRAVPRTLGLDDDPDVFSPSRGIIRDLHRRHLGLRLGSTGRVFDAALPAVIGQRVTTDEAKRSYQRLVAATGEPAPGDLGLRVPPHPGAIAGMSYVDLHAFGLERSRAQIVIEVARRAVRLEQISGMTRAEANRRLSAVRGIGPWTAAQVMGSAWGDRDAIPVGDFHLPNTVSWALAGEPRGTDERMAELLEPFRPQRRRALLLVKVSGIHAPRYGARTAQSAIGIDG